MMRVEDAPRQPWAMQVARNVGLITAGSILCVVAINGILLPQRFVSGGFAGLSLVLHYAAPQLPVSGLYFVLNVPLFAVGWFYVGRRFFLYSLAGTLIFTAAVAVIDVHVPVQDKMLAALLAGIISGAGSGLILRSLGSAGGLDILSIFLFQRFSVRLGTTILTFNSILLAASVALFLEMALYTLVYIYVSSNIVNLVVTGLSQRKAVTVISRCWEEISPMILRDLGRGVTILEGKGGYSGQTERILYTVITFRELARLKRLIHQVDPHAFVVVSDTLEVMGYRIGNQPHW